MTKGPSPERQPVEAVKASQLFYADLGLEAGYFSALWHTFSVGHMLNIDLDRICRRFDLSVADFNLMGALRIDRPLPLRPTDLALKVQVSNAALTARIAKLIEKGMLIKSPADGDRRASTLMLTPEGVALADTIHMAIEQESHFVHEVNRLPEEDRAALERIMGKLHSRLDRHLVHVPR